MIGEANHFAFVWTTIRIKLTENKPDITKMGNV